MRGGISKQKKNLSALAEIQRVSNVMKSDSDSPPRLPYPTIFSHLSTTILTFLEAVEPYLQRHPYTIIRFGFPSTPYLPHDLFQPLYHHFNFSWSGGALPPTSPLHHHQIRIPLYALPTPRFFSRLSTSILTNLTEGFTQALPPWRNT